MTDNQGARIHVHRVPEPREQNIAAIWVGDDGEPPAYSGAWLFGRKTGGFRELKPLDPNLDPSLYPLLFQRGQQGYKLGIPLKTASFTDQVRGFLDLYCASNQASFRTKPKTKTIVPLNLTCRASWGQTLELASPADNMTVTSMPTAEATLRHLIGCTPREGWPSSTRSMLQTVANGMNSIWRSSSSKIGVSSTLRSSCRPWRTSFSAYTQVPSLAR